MTDNPLRKDSYGPAIPRKIATLIGDTNPDFDQAGFVATALTGYTDLELMARARHIATALGDFLPNDPATAIGILQRSLPSTEELTNDAGISAFILMPYGIFVARHGLEHFEPSMQLQYEITKLFTSEFSIRAFIEHDQQRTLERLRIWTDDPNEHVRRLVSEGTRPRLPWAARLPRFQHDPTPVLDLLERLKDDPSTYVRRSVANNLNDISKDNPEATIAVCRRWAAESASKERRALVRHALRTLIKAGDAHALALLGFQPTTAIEVSEFTIEPTTPRIGESVQLSITLVNSSDVSIYTLLDVGIYFVKANESTSRKVFKVGEREILPGSSATFKKSISVRQHTTRTHYPGTHRVVALVNGSDHEVGAFELRTSR